MHCKVGDQQRRCPLCTCERFEMCHSTHGKHHCSSNVAKNLLWKFTDYRFVHMLHFLLDYLRTIKNLSFISEGFFSAHL